MNSPSDRIPKNKKNVRSNLSRDPRSAPFARNMRARLTPTTAKSASSGIRMAPARNPSGARGLRVLRVVARVMPNYLLRWRSLRPPTRGLKRPLGK